MSNLTNPDLLKFIVCPDCGGQLSETNNCLSCSLCSCNYEIRNGIPLLYPSSMDISHFHEEENLAKKMRLSRHMSKEQFSLTQWDLSKREFWSIVQNNVQKSPKVFINIGCGYDEGFSKIEQQGNTFINFDMIYDMLYSLQKNAAAKSCVGGDINKLPFKKGKFDYLISIDVIHHEIDNLLILLQSFRDLLKSGGMLFLEDPNAWGLFQMAKSILLPKPLYRFLRSTFHTLKRSDHRPADYEFPTNIWHVISILDRLGFRDIKIYPNTAYPCINKAGYRLYKLFSVFDFIRKYHNYHYMVSAIRQ